MCNAALCVYLSCDNETVEIFGKAEFDMTFVVQDLLL